MFNKTWIVVQVQVKVVIHLKQMYEKRIKKAVLGEGGGGVYLISLFSTDKISETGYDIYFSMCYDS